MFDKKEYIKQWRNKHKKEISEYNKKYRKDNLEKLIKQKRQWNKDNAEYLKKCSKKWKRNNPEKVKKYNKQYCKNNKEKIKICQEKYREDNYKKIKKYHRIHHRDKYKTNLKFNLNKKISCLIRQTLIKGNKAGRHWETLVGYTVSDLIKRLKKTMPKGYNWNDYINGVLEIDHIIPISVFNFTKPEHIDFKRCWALSNLRLLPAKENLSKSNKLSKPFQPTLKLCLVD